MRTSRWTLRACAFGLALLAGLAAAEDAYPSRPIRLLVGFAPGGGGDAVARIMAEHMGRTLGQTVIVENKPGAGTTLAPSAVAAAAPDGYTLALAPDSIYGADRAMWPSIVKYDAGSFTPISKWARTFFVMAANPGYGADSYQQLIAKAKAAQGDLFVASTQGPYPALIMENFSRLSGVRLSQVPYKGGAPAVMAVVSGDVPVTFAVPSSVMPMVKEGRLRALAITSAERSSLAPGVPTLSELGLRGFDVGYWFSLAGPKGLPEPVVRKLFEASAKALADPAVRAKLQSQGYEPAPSTSIAEFQAQAMQDGGALREVVERLGIKGE